ncbi:MAG: glycine oxidase ThiO [Thermoanaerobaculia bacterium]|nr:glycine oxidase ThiO [Thermoanaerobaculia bacterium]
MLRHVSVRRIQRDAALARDYWLGHNGAMRARPHSRADISIVGGGIIGLACAEALAMRGLRVQVIDRTAGRHVVGENASNSASWASAGMIAPLAEVPDDDQFLRICLSSRNRWARWAAELESATGIDLDYDRSGALLVADRPHDEPDRLEVFESVAHRVGELVQRLGAQEIRRLLPDAAHNLDVGLRLPGEHRVDNRNVCHALLRRLDQLGVEILRREVLSIEQIGASSAVRTDQDTLSTGAVLLTAGAWSSRIGGLPALPIRPLRGQMIRLSGVDWPFLGSVRGSSCYAVRRRGSSSDSAGDLLIGATEDQAGFDCRVTTAGLAELSSWLLHVFPELAEHAVAESWAGLRPSTPDGRPVLDQLDTSLWVATGHHRNGILLAPWTADTMASWIADDAVPEGQALCSFGRFSHAETEA